MPNQQGCFCAQCQKAVVDFTAMTDEQLLAHLQQTDGPGCGRFRPDQLNRTLGEPLNRRVSRWRWAGLLLSGWLSSQAAQAQSGNEPETVATTITPTTEQTTDLPDASVARPTSLTIEGRVVEAVSRRPILGATVQVSNSRYGVIADTTGWFRLVIPQLPTHSTLQLTARSIGYVAQTLSVSPATAGQLLVFALPDDPGLLSGEVVIVGGYVAQRPTLWRRIRHWFRR